MRSFDAHPRDDDERAVDECRIAFDQREQPANHEPHRDDAEDAAGQHHPPLRRHGHGDENRVDCKDDVGQLDFNHGHPESAEAEHRLRFGRSAASFRGLAAEEMLVNEEQQIPGAEDFYPGERDEINREERRERAKNKGAEDAVAERLASADLWAVPAPGPPAPSRCLR